jgi:hypothetical protein
VRFRPRGIERKRFLELLDGKLELVFLLGLRASFKVRPNLGIPGLRKNT